MTAAPARIPISHEMLKSLIEFHVRLDWTEPWVRELEIVIPRFGFMADAITATLVSIELVMVLSNAFTDQFARLVLDGRLVRSSMAVRPGDRDEPWGLERNRLARLAVSDVWREACDLDDELNDALETVLGHPEFDPEWRPIVRAMVAVKHNVNMLCDVVAYRVGIEPRRSREPEGLPLGDLEVLALSDGTVQCLRAGEVNTVYDLLEATEEELLELANVDHGMLDEIGGRLVAAGFVSPESRGNVFLHEDQGRSA